MSLEAERERHKRHIWAAPGSSHDILVGRLKRWLPIILGMLAAFLATAPLTRGGDVSFVLDKQKVAIASERMRVTEALYRGSDSKGQPFSLRAESAVQKTSRDPVVDLRGISARILMSDGPATLVANNGRYMIDEEKLHALGPVQFASAGGYRLTTRDVNIDLKSRQIRSRDRVDGRMKLGTFSADHLESDMRERTFTLSGRARLRIEQNGLKGQ